MAKQSSKALVIVESPAKARTISKFLGPGYRVEASIGHVRDLPSGAKDLPSKYRGENWAYLGVNVDEDFAPVYVIPPEKKKHVEKLKDALADATDLYLATDEDREGEAISWHLHEILKPKIPVHRLVFHEITQEAIKSALDHPRQIDKGLVKAQETRRILDRLYGYDVSQLLWKKVGRGLSAGRVQSVAVRLIVERERERMAFRSATYWDLEANFRTQSGQNFTATLVEVDGQKIPTGKDFDGKTGRLKTPNLRLLDGPAAEQLASRLRDATFKVLDVEVKPFVDRPKPPFTTSTLQQEANRKLGFTARRTMQVAQSLYENGYITYMRTDSTTLAKVALDAARDLVQTEYGANYLHPEPRVYASKVKNAQEAHEAIRPAGHPFQKPETLRQELDRDQYRLFEMIWKRTIASQMADARKRRVTVTIGGDGAIFVASGTSIEFEGFLRAYVEGSDDPEAELADREKLLPALEREDLVACNQLSALSHTTQPPPRFSEASLTRALEERGIGRPSTYATIIDTIQQRNYVFKKGNALVPSWTAFSVTRLMEDHLGSLVDYEFTAQMEDLLDAISRGEAEHVQYLNDFYLGEQGLKKKLEVKVTEIDPRQTARFPVGRAAETAGPDDLCVRVGKYGPFLEQGDRRASVPADLAPDELTLERAQELLNQSEKSEEPLCYHPETEKPIYVKEGRFGAYLQYGSNDDPDKKNASLLRGMTIDQLTPEQALGLLSLPRTLGQHEGADVIASNGRFGPYVRCGNETRSLPAHFSPIDVTLEQAVELIRQPKQTGRRGASAIEPLKTLGPSPVTEQVVKLMKGRYGPYVTDGQTNASLPKEKDPDSLTLEEALNLLAERLARGGGRKKGRPTRGGTAPTKKAPAKKATTKRAPAKKTNVKKKTKE
jgi:DNA topoisomerase-1